MSEDIFTVRVFFTGVFIENYVNGELVPSHVSWVGNTSSTWVEIKGGE